MRRRGLSYFMSYGVFGWSIDFHRLMKKGASGAFPTASPPPLDEIVECRLGIDPAPEAPLHPLGHVHPPVRRLAPGDPRLGLLQPLGQLPLIEPSPFAQLGSDQRLAALVNRSDGATTPP